MSYEDLRLWVKEWFKTIVKNKRLDEEKRNRNKRTFGELRDDDIDFDNLKLNIIEGSLKWSETDTGNRLPVDTQTEATILKTTQDAPYNQAAPQMQIAGESDILGEVTLTAGKIKGLNKLLSLPLPEKSDLKKFFGESVNINLGQEVTEIKKDNMTIAVSLEVAGKGFSVTTQVTKKQFTGHFECKVAIHGQVIINDNGKALNHSIREIIKDLNVGFFTVGKQEVIFTLEGEITFLGDPEQTVEWSDVHT